MLKLKLQYFGHLMQTADSLVKTLKLVGWHHQFNGHELGQTPKDGEGQGSLECCSPRGRKESGQDLATEQQHHAGKEIETQRGW